MNNINDEENKQIVLNNYEEVIHHLSTYENGKYKDFILKEEDIEFIHGYAIFDIEDKDKNKTLHSIAFCTNLGNEYINTCKWLLQNGPYYPGLLRPDMKLFIVSKKLRLCIMLSSTFQDIVLFKFFENKEDGVFQCYSLEYTKDNFQLGNILKAVEYYYKKDTKVLQEELKEKNNILIEKLNNL